MTPRRQDGDMPTVTTLSSVAIQPALVKTVMSEVEYLALGETKHDEYYDGMRIVNPPTRRHQRAEMAVYEVLRPLVPEGYELFVEWGWRTGASWFRPDLMIVPADGPADIARDPPLLIVEIVSPANRLDDIVTKREKYARGGLSWYWIVDLDEPSLLVLQLVNGVMIERQRLSAAGTTFGPLRVEIDPAALA
jgi:Uma2 family endonuclease